MKRGAAAILVWCVPTLVLAQSLADVASKEKERRQKNAEAGVEPRVVTEEELKAGKGELANDPDAPGMYEPAAEEAPVRRRAGGGRAGEEAGAGKADSQEQLWRSRYASAAAELDSAEKHYADLTSRPGWEQPMPRPDRYGRLVTPLPKPEEDVTLAKARLEQARAALDNLRELARRQGVPPGWLR